MSVTVYAADGRQVLVLPGVREVDVSGLPAGLYLFQMRDEKGRALSTRKLLKE